MDPKPKMNNEPDHLDEILKESCERSSCLVLALKSFDSTSIYNIYQNKPLCVKLDTKYSRL